MKKRFLKRMMPFLVTAVLIMSTVSVSAAPKTMEAVAGKEYNETVKYDTELTVNYTAPKGYSYLKYTITTNDGYWPGGFTMQLKEGSSVLFEPELRTAVEFTTRKLDLKPGGVTKLVLKQGPKSSVTGSYDGKVNVKFEFVNKPSAYFETEKNNTKKTADTVKVKKTYTGILRGSNDMYDRSDVDFFKFKAPSKGNYALKAKVKEASTDVYSDRRGYYWNAVLDGYGLGTEWKTIRTFKLKKGAKKYIKAEQGSNVVYSFKIVKK